MNLTFIILMKKTGRKKSLGGRKNSTNIWSFAGGEYLETE